MRSAHLFLTITIVLPLMAGGLRAETSAPPPVVSVIADSVPGQPAQHGIDKIIAALKDKQVSFETVNTLDDAKGKMLIVAGLASAGSKAVEVVDFNVPDAGKTGPIAIQIHNKGLFDEYRDITVEVDPKENELITVK
jgi:hypothetical protein